MAGRVAVPTILQTMPNQSGPCALGMVLAHHGLRLPRFSVQTACGALLSPERPAPLLKAAEGFGLKGSLRQDVEVRTALAAPLPAIVLLTDGQFVVLEGEEDGQIWLNTPADGPVGLALGRFTQLFAGTLLTLAPGPKFAGGGMNPSLVAMVLTHLRGGFGAMGVVLVTSTLLLLPSVAMPAFTQIFIDNILLKNLSSWLFPLVLGLSVCVVFAATTTAIQQYFMKRLEAQIATATASRMVWRCLSAPVLYFSHVSVGDAVARLVGANRVAALLSSRLGANFSNLITAAFYLTILMLYSPTLGLISLGLTSVNVAVVRRVDAKRGALNARQVQQIGQTYAMAVNGFRAIETMKAMAMESFFFRKQAELAVRTIANQQRTDQLSLWLNMAPEILTAINSAVILTLGATFVIDGALSIGELIAFQMLSSRFAKPIGDLVGSTQEAQELRARLIACDAIARAPVDPVTLARPAGAAGGRLSGRIEIRDLRFAYNPNDPMLFDGLSLSVQAGTRVALVGGSGSGKSTLGRVALGLYQPMGGSVLYDGQAIEDIARPLWAASVGYVSQDVALFEGSVRDNITLWDETIPIEDVRRAAQDAEIDDIIAARPGGYDGPVAEGGANFSGGQRQRIEIARALVRNPRILLLDEATAALDAETEKRIDDNLRRRGCTCLIIAHRLSTLRDADDIVVLDQGRVVERGTHVSLMAAGGRYAQLLSLS